MKLIQKIQLLLLIFIPLHSFSQPYLNEWIDYDKEYYKFSIVQNGIYRITYNTLENSGFPVSSVNGSDFQLFYKGQEIPIYVTTSGTLNTSDFLEFYAEKNDGILDKKLYQDTTWQPQTLESHFTDSSSYYLTWNNSTTNLRYTTIINDTAGHGSPETFCWVTKQEAYQEEFIPGKGYATSGDDVYSANFEIGEGYVGNGFAIPSSYYPSSRTYTIGTPNAYVAGPNTQIETRVLSSHSAGHHVTIQVNDAIYIDDVFNGWALNTYNINYPTSSLSSSTNLTFTSLDASEYDRNHVTYAKISYPHTFDFENQTSFHFSLQSANTSYLVINNFNDQNTTPILYDLINQQRFEGIEITNQHIFNLPNTSQNKELYITNQHPSVIKSITSLEKKTFIDYNQLSNQGDFILLTHPSLTVDSNGNNYINAYRNQKILSGYNPIVVFIDELYDQFVYGVKKHPLAIRNFVSFVSNNWDSMPNYLLIIGKGVEYDKINTASSYQSCLIPTYGNPGSDNLLSASLESFTPKIPIGRIAATSPEDIKIYLDKVQEYEQNRLLPQTVADRIWMKNILHLGGGSNNNQQKLFKNFLENYRRTIEDSLFGGSVNSFYKTSSDPIQISISAQLDSIINSGVSLITFFGHGSANSFDYSVDNPNNYDNKGKYPVIISNACFTGAIHLLNRGLSEAFLFAKDKGAIGFLSTSSLSLDGSLNKFSSTFYDQLSKSGYGKGVGKNIQLTIQEIENTSRSNFNRIVTEQMNYHGDPSINLNTHVKPDYVLEQEQVKFESSIIYTDADFFSLEATVYNIGRSIQDSFHVKIIRTYPDGSAIEIIDDFRKAPIYSETITYAIPTDAINAFGMNEFMVQIDANNEIDELSETNNQVETSVFIFSDNIIPVHPYDNSIVSESSLSLKASTVDVFAPIKTYFFELDTTQDFTSPFKISTSIQSIGGMLEWSPVVELKDGTVYYWRTSVDSSINESYNWHTSSFTYLTDTSTGWRQSHYNQLKDSRYFNIKINPNNTFTFVDNVSDIRVVNGNAYTSSLGFDQIAYYLNTTKMHNWKCFPLSGWYVTVFDSATGLPWTSPPGGSGKNDVNCKNYAFPTFRFADNPLWVKEFMDSIPNGHFMMLTNLNYAPGTDPYYDTFYTYLEGFGAQRIRENKPTTPYLFFTQKGNLSYPHVEVISDTSIAIIDTTFSFPGIWTQGYIETPLIGPAKNWNDISWGFSGVDNPKDHYFLTVIGVQSDESETILISKLYATDTIVNFISADSFPFLKLQFHTIDDSMRTPVQLEYWQVNYDEVPDVALAPNLFYEFSNDTLQQGESLLLTMAIVNVSNTIMDSLQANYSIINNHTVVNTIKYAPVSTQDSIHAIFNYNTSALTNEQALFLEINPNRVQPEQHAFNNVAYIPFSISTDATNPLLDVTFDGVHILDGDIVSAAPEILITLKDENEYLAIDDTSLLNIFLVDPEFKLSRVAFNQPDVQFYPAVVTKNGDRNKASIQYTPSFKKDGVYQLIVQAQDKTGNASGSFDYKNSFEIISKPSITNILNYPNPFTSSTRFLFTLTGSELPVYFKIQIMTVTGKIIREIQLEELGPIHIGRNITQFAWDGTDQFGDPVGNGVYLYRVVTSMDGQTQMNHRANDVVDKFFESGFGKMYLAR